MKALPILAGAAFGFAAITTHGDDLEFRTDINPALLYFQAFQLMPGFTEKETETLHETEWDWRDRRLTDEFHTLVGRYDQSFKLLNRARHAEPACEWGYDLSDGPWAYLPGLAPAKRMSQLARFRAMSFLDKGEEQAAVRDLTAGYILARNLAKDRVPISALVQIAIEELPNATMLTYRNQVMEFGEITTASSGPGMSFAGRHYRAGDREL